MRSKPRLIVALLAMQIAGSACQVSLDVGVERPVALQLRDLEPGDCIESFDSMEGISRGVVAEVATIDCALAHDIEVSAIIDVSATIETYPGATAMEFQAGSTCLTAFSEYAEIDPWDTNLISGQIYPLPPTWEQGDRQISCLIHHRDRTPLEGSTRAAGDDLFVDLGHRVHWQSVAVGECLNNVALLGFTGEFSVTLCASLHEAEVYHVAEVTAFGDEYPGDEALRDHVRDECADRVEGYVGGPLGAEWDTARFGPDEFGWTNGDRKMICVITDRTPGIRISDSAADSS